MFVRLSVLQDHLQLIWVFFSKQKELDSDPRAIQWIEFYRMLDTKSQVCTNLEKKHKKQY